MSAGLRELHSNEAIRESYKTYKKTAQTRYEPALFISFLTSFAARYEQAPLAPAR
jgi:hypothetical protein